ncbi:MAG: COG3014 family protein [bacterium]
MRKNLKLFFIPILCLLAGCATYGTKVEQVQIKLSQGKYEEALKKLEKTKSNRSMLLYLMEKGTLLHYAGKYEESNKIFDQAEYLAEDLYTKSISREAGALFTSDNILPYDGEKFERVLIHYYKALNYIHLKLPESALVECRKVSILLQKYADDAEGKSTAYADDAFIHYLAGALFEWQGELNDAFISYRKAESAYDKYMHEYNVSPPSMLRNDLIRMSKKLGFSEEYEYYVNKYNINDGLIELNKDDGTGELIIIHENGFAPRKTSKELLIPILRTDKIDEKIDIIAFSGELQGRINRRYDEVDLEYILRVSIPEYLTNRPLIGYMKIKANGIEAKSEIVEDIEAIAFKNFNERMPRILLKTIARGVTKYITFRTAKKKQGEGAGLLVNVFNIITESADTRSWLSLPNNFQIIRRSMPPGKYNIQLSFYSKNGKQLKSANIPNVEIKKGDFTFINYRTFQ